MIRLLTISLAVLAGLFVIALWRIDHVTADRDAVVTAKQLSDASLASLRVTLRLQRELANDQASIETSYLEDKQHAEDEADRLRECINAGTCGLRVAASCPRVRVGGAGPIAGEPDAGIPELTTAARRAYPTLVAGLASQRAQIAGLQKTLINLHSKCKIIGDPE